jgi:hypothetical protein
MTILGVTALGIVVETPHFPLSPSASILLHLDNRRSCSGTPYQIHHGSEQLHARVTSLQSFFHNPVSDTSSSVALITGAASGIGRATAHTFVQEGCTRLILGDLDYAGLEVVAEELRARNAAVRTVIVAVDVSSEEQVDSFIEAGIKEFGAVHYAVNNAGITSNPRVRTHELPTDAWDRVVDVNLRGAWLCERAELRQMMRQGVELESRCVPILLSGFFFFQLVRAVYY